MIKNTLHFNTGRQYSAQGQRITATLHADQCVTFWDHDRMVDGEFKLCGDHFDASVVLSAYDQGIAQPTTRSHENGMFRGGCNADFAA